MHSRRWGWLSKEMTNTWPLINSQNISPQSGGVNANADYAAGVRGRLPNGFLVVVDNNIATNTGGSQDEIYVVPSSECLLSHVPSSHLSTLAGAAPTPRCDRPGTAEAQASSQVPECEFLFDHEPDQVRSKGDSGQGPTDKEMVKVPGP